MAASETECLVYGVNVQKLALSNLSLVVYSGVVYIAIITTWRYFFNYLIEDAAIKFAERQKYNTTSPINFKNKIFNINKDKYKESFWKSITTFPIMLYGFYVMWLAEYFWNTELLFISWPQSMTSFELLYYKISLGYHGHRAIYGLFFEKKRSDYHAYVIHHGITVFLIIGSWIYGLTSFGIVVMALHDSADVFLASAKTFAYHNITIGVLISYPSFCISWLIFRIIIFPIKIIYPLLFIGKKQYDCHPLYYVFVIGLCILYCLHVAWGKSIIGPLTVMIRKPTSKQVLSDPRSDTDDNDDYNHIKQT